MDGSATAVRCIGALRLVLGTALLLPFLLGAPFIVSLLASLDAFVLLVTIEKGLEDRARGRWVRRAAIASSALEAVMEQYGTSRAILCDILHRSHRNVLPRWSRWST